jgi:signal transduction histidine kinase
MLGNLLDNACKWATRRVTLTGAVANGRLRLTVDDDGAGMAPGAMQAALRRGVRLDERVAGSGLGLAIVLDLAESYGGQLTLGRSTLGGLAAELELPTA